MVTVKPSNVLGDPLVRVGEFAGDVQAVVGFIGEVELDGSLSQGFPPEQTKALLREACDDRNDRGPREHADVENRLAHEFGFVTVGDRGHEIPADVAVEDVQAVCAEQQRNERGEDQLRLPADLGIGKVSNRSDKARQRRHVRSFLRVHFLTGPTEMALREC